MRDRRPISRRRAAGLTFIEVVVCVALVAGMSTIVLGAVGLMENAALRDRYRLEAIEVAHRVILQMVDDPAWLNNQTPRVEHNGSFYVFEVRRDIMVHEDSAIEDGAADRPRRSSVSTRSLEDSNINQVMASQVLQVTVWVFLERPDGTVGEQPLAELVRVHNPITGSGKAGLKWMMQLLQDEMSE